MPRWWQISLGMEKYRAIAVKKINCRSSGIADASSVFFA